jgi:hypothetical protein
MSAGHIKIGILPTASDDDIRALVDFLNTSKDEVIKKVVEDVGAYR